MTEHDARILAPKTKAVAAGADRTEWGRRHAFCAACGAGEYGLHVLTTHELIGGRGGRSQESCNWLRLGMHPCHDLASMLDVRDESAWHVGGDRTCRECGDETDDDGVCRKRPLLPKITLGIALAMKLRSDPQELESPAA